MRLDLHLHTQFSDGQHPAATVLEMAYRRGASLCALTDHDTVQAYFHIDQSAIPDLVFLPGVEITTENGLGKESHLLIYFPRFAVGTDAAFQRLSLKKPPPPSEEELAALCAFEEELATLRKSRISRARSCMELLSSVYGLELSWDEFCEDNRKNQQTSTSDGTIGRLHIAKYLIAKQYCSTVQEAFDKYLNNEQIRSVKKEALPFGATIRRILQLGGVPSLAHCCLKHDWAYAEKIVAEGVSVGMRHLEVYHPKHTSEEIKQLKTLCRAQGLTPTVGTDFHGDLAIYRDTIPPGGYEDFITVISEEEKKNMVRSIFTAA